MAEAWYPLAGDYFVDQEDEADYPVRQGDVFGPDPAVPDWRGFLIIHPSCEIQTGKAEHIQVARIRAVSELADEFQRTAITYGFTESAGIVRVAFGHTFWLPPAFDERVGTMVDPSFVDFREVTNLPRTAVDLGKRLRALSHEARIFLIRRMLYFRFRWNIPAERVRDIERARILADGAFQGPRPEWAAP